MISMPKFGLMVNPSMNLAKHMKEIHKNGFDYAELTIEPPNVLPEKIRKDIKEIKKAGSLFPHKMVGHTAWWLDLGTEYSLLRRATIAEFKKSIDICQALGIEYMNIHEIIFGLYTGKNMSKIVLRNFAAVIGMLKDAGYDRTITFEVFTSMKDAVRSRKKFRKMWEK